MKELLRFFVTLLIAGVIIGIVAFFLNTSEYKIRELDKIVTEEAYDKVFEDTVGADILGNTAKSFLEFFELNKVYAQIGVAPGRITIIPMPDSLNQQTYYYNKGELVLYISTSNTVGGQIWYYFSNGKLIGTKKTDGLKEIDAALEDVNDVLSKSKNIYEKYMQ